MNIFQQKSNVPPPLYVGDLDLTVNEEALHHHFSKFGPIFVIKIARDPATQVSKGYGFVTFLNYHDAEKARQLSNYEKILSYPNPIRVMWKRAPQDFSPEANIFVKDLPEDITPRELENLFRSCGQIHTIKIAKDHNDPNRSLGYGYVQFNTEEEATKCIQDFNGFEQNGRRISVEKFVPRNKRDDNVSNQRNLFLKHLPTLPQDELDKVIRNTYSAYGEVQSIALRYDENHKGYFAFICFNSHEEAQKAYEATTNSRILDQYATEEQKQSEPLYVNWAQKKYQRTQELKEAFGKQVSKTNIFLRNLLLEVTEEQLKNLFFQFGEITSIFVKEAPINLQGKTGNPKFACLNFQDAKSADDAVSNAPNNEEIKKLFIENKPYITHHQPKDKRQEYINVMRRTKMMFSSPFNFGQFGQQGFNPMMMGMMNPLAFLPPPGMGNLRLPPRGGPGFGAPGFGAPGFGEPGFGAPGFGAPPFGAPGFGPGNQQPYRRGPPIAGGPGGPGGPVGPGGVQMGPPRGRNMPPQNRNPRGQMRGGPKGMPRRPPGGFPPQGFPPQGFLPPGPGIPPSQGIPPQGFAPQGLPPQQQQGFPPQQPQGFPPQVIPPQQKQQFIQNEAKTKIGALRSNMDEFLRRDREEQRRILGDMLFPLVDNIVSEKSLAPKITGMLVDFDVMEVPDILELIEDEQQLGERIEEAVELIKASGEETNQ